MNFKSAIIIFFITLPLAVALRFYQLSEKITNPSTGFRQTSSPVTSTEYLIVALIGLLILGMFILGRFAAEKKDPVFLKSIPLSIVSFLNAVGVSLYMFNCYSTDATSEMTTSEITMYALSIAFIITSLYHGFCFMASVKILEITTIIPIIYWGVRLGFSFVAKTGIARTTDNVIEIIMLCFTLIFYLFAGRLISNIETKKARNWIHSFALIGSIICFTSAVPHLVMERFMNLSLHKVTTYGILDIISGIYMIVFVFALHYSDKKVGKTDSKPIVEYK